jgi:hypothetical protein
MTKKMKKLGLGLALAACVVAPFAAFAGDPVADCIVDCGNQYDARVATCNGAWYPLCLFNAGVALVACEAGCASYYVY